MDAIEKRKISRCRESNPGPSSPDPLAYRLSDPGSYAETYTDELLDGLYGAKDAV
jgi:hypothetical protein